MNLPRTLVCVAGSLLMNQAGSAPAAQRFDRVRAPETIDSHWQAHLCALMPQPCEADTLELFRARGAAETDYVVLARKPLAMGRLRRSAAGANWELVSLQDFSSYVRTVEKLTRDGLRRDIDTTRWDFSLAPALYPLSQGQWAVAILQTWVDMYSGGSANFNYADFVPLDGTQAARQLVPFSCTKMIRACFSEADYKRLKHCHDESNGSLRITYRDAVAAWGPYRWQFAWVQTEWPADVAPSAKSTSRTPYTDASIGEADFCGGPDTPKKK